MNTQAQNTKKEYIKKELYVNATDTLRQDLRNDMYSISQEIDADNIETIQDLNNDGLGIAFSAISPLNFQTYMADRKLLSKDNYKFPAILQGGALKSWKNVPSQLLSENFFSRRPLLIPFSEQHIGFFSNIKHKDLIYNTLELLGLKAITALPDALAQCIIIDKNGSGNNFPHILTFDKKITNKVMTEEAEIERILFELKQSITSIAQSITQKQYTSIEQYNNNTDEIPQPYKFLFIADFPHGFTKRAMDNLNAILSNGAQSGIYVFMTISLRSRDGLSQSIGGNLRLEDIAKNMTIFEVEENSMHDYTKQGLLNKNVMLAHTPLRDSKGIKALYNNTYKIDFEKFNADLVQDIISDLNKRIEGINIKPIINILKTLPQNKEDYWTRSASKGLCTPFAKAGIENIYLSLGVNNYGEDEATYHGLIVGATGSGKTVALHDIILQTAIHYSPEEVEFWLLDYKEGTEFAAYKDFPYVKILSMESEIEFGHQVLKKAIDEIERRGDLFKQMQVNNLQGYNEKINILNKESSSKLKILPRIVIVIDEFQNLFPNLPRITSITNERMDDALRRGRSFGVNIILATQTLLGINMDQSLMSNLQLRIALKMADKDIPKVFSENNLAPRTLRDPGQGIYNRSGGVEGENVFFQAYYADMKAISTIQENILSLMQERYSPEEYQDFFKNRFIYNGDTPANISNNSTIKQPLNTFSPYIGESSGLQLDHLKLQFKSEYADNLLMVGNNILHASSIFGYILDQLANCKKESSIYFGAYYSTLQNTFEARIQDKIKNQKTAHPNTQLAFLTNVNTEGYIQELSDELDRRKEALSVATDQKDEKRKHKSIFFMLFFADGMNILRAGYSADETQKLKKKQLFKIIELGPELGIHTCLFISDYRKVVDFDLNSKLGDFKKKIVLKGGTGNTKIFGDDSTYQESSSKNVAMYSSGGSDADTQKFKPYIDATLKKVIEHAENR
ncbi:FtsK/SpoIIIE domain-containing protein [Campylobacter sp. MOP7]|uniref:FtsK/SpoIIIE domain-containing protein n=1 Tax=Campylobacter canis TaxID=3378588 RepID=UPI00387EE807